MFIFDFFKTLYFEYKYAFDFCVCSFLIVGYILLGVFGGFHIFDEYACGRKTKQEVFHACGFYVIWPLFFLVFLFKVTIIGIGDFVDYVVKVFKSLIFENETEGDNPDYSLRHPSKD